MFLKKYEKIALPSLSWLRQEIIKAHALHLTRHIQDCSLWSQLRIMKVLLGDIQINCKKIVKISNKNVNLSSLNCVFVY